MNYIKFQLNKIGNFGTNFKIEKVLSQILSQVENHSKKDQQTV